MLAPDLLAQLGALPPEGRVQAAVEALAGLGTQARDYLYDWRLWARPEQLPPEGDWDGWLILSGRGWGKTRTGAEWVRYRIEREGARRIALIGQTAADVRDVMVEGESGILAVHPPETRPQYQPSLRRLTWPSGAVATTYSGDSPDQLRGPQHDTVWADEPAKWQYPTDCWSNLELGLRLGDRPRWLATTTPRPIPLIRALLVDPRVRSVQRPTTDNSDNLPAAYLRRVVQRYEGTRLGRQELYAEVLEDVVGALWSRDLIERTRVREAPALVRVAVAVDPQGTAAPDSSGESAGETGIVVVGLGDDGHGYVLQDATASYTPRQWAMRAIDLYRTWHAAWIVAEVNYGGDMVSDTLRAVDPSVSVSVVRASRGKARRAEPVVALYEQGRVHHVGSLPELEDQLCTWTEDGGQPSPDRLDALVWGVTRLMVQHALGLREPEGGPKGMLTYRGYNPSRHRRLPVQAQEDPDK